MLSGLPVLQPSSRFPKSHFSSDSFIKGRSDQTVFLSLRCNLAFHVVGPSDKKWLEITKFHLPLITPSLCWTAAPCPTPL